MHAQSQPLFLRATRPSLIKRAMRRVKISDKPSEWATEILNHLYAEFPALSGRDVKIAFQSRDEKKAYAVGKLVVDGKMSIPFFIDKGFLEPLDTYVQDGIPHRLNDRRMKESLFRPGLFAGVIKPDEEKSLAQDEPIYQQTQVNDFREGRRIYASLIEDILPTISRTDLEKIAQALKDDPQMATDLVLNGHSDLINRIVTQGGSSDTAETIMKAAYAQLPANVIQIRPDGDSYRVKIASDAGYDPHEIRVPGESIGGVLRTLSIDPARAQSKLASGETFTFTDRAAGPRPLYVSGHGSAGAIQKFGAYRVKELGGQEYVGVVYPEVYDFDKRATSQMLFVSPELTLVQEKIAGLPADPIDIASDHPYTNDVGCFVFEGHGNGIATIPVAISSIVKVGADVEINAHTLQGKELVFKLGKNARDLTPLRRDVGGSIDVYLMPATAKFARLKEGLGKALITDGGALTKMAVDEVKGDTATVRGFRGTFTLQGPLVSGMDDGYTELEGDELIFKLACLGLDAEEAAQVADRAHSGEDVVIAGLRRPERLETKLARVRDDVVLPALSEIMFLKEDVAALLKVASTIKDPEIVDKVLSIGMLNPQNVQILVERIKELDKTSSGLSEILLGSRYGAKEDIDQDAIIQAREAIDRVLDGLGNLKSRLGPQTDVA